MKTTRDHHYGYIDRQCIPWDHAHCTADNKAKRSYGTGGVIAGRWPVGLPTGQAA